MVEPTSLFVLAVSTLANNTPHWLHALEGTVLSKGKEVAISQGKHFLDSKQHQEHMHKILENAAKKGIIQFQTPIQRDQYRAIIEILAQSGPNSEALIREALSLFTLSYEPDLSRLTEIYNLRERIKAFAQQTTHHDVDTSPYLKSFFEQFRDELFADDLFRQPVSDILILRSNLSMQASLTEIATTLPTIKDAITNSYSEEQLAQDVHNYIVHIEEAFRYLKMVGIVPKDQNKDPEIDGIFVPLRVALQDRDRALSEALKEDSSLVALLEKCSSLVLLGGPGSGKSTATKYLSWSHAAAKLSDVPPSHLSLLSGNPIPLCLELRRLSEDRRNNANYTFLSYAEALLRREGIEIHPQMFKHLLVNKCMLLLFDGLDEVATLDERKGLVEEIEGFIRCYPGNRVIVTSRPVGYELTRFSNQLFTHTQVQNFNDAQIQEFLERWYTHMLRLSPIPYNDQQELEELFRTLQENQRLHTLAENPLLLTVITPLHRYERLPDKRVQVYDRCADILLETWAKLRGTKARWRDIQMAKEDQYACVAYLGFVLHKRSHENDENDESDTEITEASTFRGRTSVANVAIDVPTRFILKEIKNFLKDRALIRETTAQKIEAERFLELMQVEAGLIVERGTGEDNESLYGFVHRTFQEYFAAADVYERYQQEVDLTIISDFLIEHLHDSHWREVILLLLGKIKRKPLTGLLRQIFEGTIKSRRSKGTDILHQDLFFICQCLAEEIVVEEELVEKVILRLSDIVKTSPFRSQRTDAARHMGHLIMTRQYAKYGQEALATLVMSRTLEVDTKIDITRATYDSNSSKSKGMQPIAQILFDLAQHLDIPIKQRIQATSVIIYSQNNLPEERRKAAHILLELAQRPDVSIEQRIQAASPLCNFFRLNLPEEQQKAVHILLELVQRPDLSIEQRIQAASPLFRSNLPEEEQREAAHILLELVQNPDLSIEQRIQAASPLCFSFLLTGSEEQNQVAHILLELAQRPDLSIDQRIQATIPFRFSGISLEHPTAAPILLEFAERLDLPIEQRIRAACALTFYNSSIRLQADQMLLSVVNTPSFTVDQRLQALARFIGIGTTAINTIDSKRVQAMQTVFDLLHDDAVTHYIEQHWQHADRYYAEGIHANDLSTLMKLFQNDLLPLYVRNNIYEVLIQRVSQFDEIPDDA